jgi:twinkle protein
MAGHCIERLHHDDPSCKAEGDSMQVFLNTDGTYSGFCYHHDCMKYIADPYKNGSAPDPKSIQVKTPEEIQEEIDEIRTCEFVPNAYRKIPQIYWKEAGVRLLISEFDGKTPYGIAHPYTSQNKLVGYKIKLFERNAKGKRPQWSVGETRGADLYNWHKAKKIGGQVLYITEGEEDCIALRYILRAANIGTKYAELDYAVVSLPNGAESVTRLGMFAEEISERWEKVVFVFDDDDAGRKASREGKKYIPDAFEAKLPEKDAAECVKTGKLKAAKEAVIFRATKKAPSEVKKFSSVIDKALEVVEMGKSFPWPVVTKNLYGQRKPSLVGLGAGTGIGKTTILHELAAWNAKKHGWRSLNIFMEETNEESLRYICGKVDNIPYNTPELEYDKEQLRRTATNLEPYIDLWDCDNNGEPEETWEAIKRTIRRVGEDYDCISVDNITTLSEGLDGSDKNNFIAKVAKESADLSLKFNLQIILVSHLNAPAKGQRPHENGGVVHESQFTGSRGMQRYCTLMMGFERNKYAIDINCSFITGIKVRKAGKTFRCKTYYDEATGRLVQRHWEDDLYKDDKIKM